VSVGEALGEDKIRAVAQRCGPDRNDDRVDHSEAEEQGDEVQQLVQPAENARLHRAGQDQQTQTSGRDQ
jgi:hypothetical protein